jgi:hypothetical protein
MNFAEAVRRTSDLAQCLMVGLQALGANSKKISVPKNRTRNLEGSVDIDDCVKNKYPNDQRWDYVFGYRGRVYYIEIHPAGTSEVNVVIAKLNWLKQWRKQATALESLRNKSSYYWIASKGINITRNSKYRRMLDMAGIAGPCSRLDL